MPNTVNTDRSVYLLVLEDRTLHSFVLERREMANRLNTRNANEGITQDQSNALNDEIARNKELHSFFHRMIHQENLRVPQITYHIAQREKFFEEPCEYFISGLSVCSFFCI